MSFRDVQNPGIGGLEELTTAEELFLQNLAGLSYAQGDLIYHNGTNLVRLPKGTGTQHLAMNAGATAPEWVTAGGTGTVTSVSVVSANGVSGSVATATTTPAITLTLGVIVPTSVNGLTLASQTVGFTIAGGTTSKTLTVDETVSLTGYALLAGRSGGQTLIGGTASGNNLLLNSTSNATKGLVSLGSATTGVIYDETNNRLSIGGTENVLTIAGISYGNTFAVHAEGATDLGEIAFERHSDTIGFGAHLLMVRSRGSEAVESIVQNNDILARIDALGHDGTDYAISSQIDFEVDGVPGSGDMPGRIRFLVSPDGSEIPAEALRISQDKTVRLASLTASEIVGTDASKNLVSLAVATYPSLTELTYVKGVTSAIQTQLGTKQATITFGTGVQTALGVNVGSAGAPVLFDGALGTPSAGTLTNCTGLPVAGITASTSTALGVGSVELGHGSDTTLSRVSAGVVAIEGVNVVTTSSTDTLSNKTLTAPKFADTGFIADGNGNEQIKFSTTASAVNEITVKNSATTTNPQIQATGGDTNIGIDLVPKGTGIVKGELKRFMVRLLSSTTDQTTGTTIGGDYRISNRAITVKAVGAYVDTAGTTNLCTVDINEAGTTILSTKITIDSTEKSSETAATPPVISDSAIAADAIITFDIDAIQTTAAKGLVVWIDYVYA